MKQIYLFICMLFSIAGYAQCVTPVITSAEDPESVCSGSTAQLSATADSGTISWYNSSTGGTALATGENYETEPLSGPTSFWVESQNTFVEAPISGGAKVAPTSTGGTTVNLTTAPWGLIFNAYQDFVLNSVDVFLSSTTPGTIVLQLKDNNLNVLETVNVAAPAGGSSAAPVQFTVPLNFYIEQANGYRLVVASGPAMIRDLASSSSFPAPIGSVGQVTQGTINNSLTNATTYYFLYNWNFSPVTTCSSVREEVVVAVNPTPDAPAGEATQTFTAGETLADLDVTGEMLMWYADADGQTPLDETTLLEDGATYYVNQTVSGCTSEMLAVMADDPLAIAENNLTSLRYFPNPTSATVTFSNSEVILDVVLFTLQGQMISSKIFGTNEAVLDVSQFAAGTYVAKIRTQTGTQDIKIVKK
jgi:hypothetical protein